MVDASDHCPIDFRRTHCAWWQQCGSSIHLFSVLSRPKPYRSNPHQTALTIVCGLLILHVWRDWSFALGLALILSLLVLLSRTLGIWIERAWFGLAGILGRIVPPVVLSLVYFLFLVPVALASRLFRSKDPLMIHDQRNSTWRKVDKDFSGSDMEKPW